jgi:hypothetical protein
VYFVSICTTSGIGKARKFICSNHYSGTCPPCQQYWGLYTKGGRRELIGVLAFGWPTARQLHDGVTFELKRLVLIDDTPKNTESWFIGKCLKYLARGRPEIKRVISYADEGAGHTGIVYRASNFEYKGTNKPGGGTYIINGIETHGRHVYDGIPKEERNLKSLQKKYNHVEYKKRTKKHLYEYKLRRT